MLSWRKTFQGAWVVWDDRTYDLIGRHETQYMGYSKREAQRVHAAYVRSLRGGRR